MPAFVTRPSRGYVAVAFASPLPDPTIAGWTAPRRRARGADGHGRHRGHQPGQYAYDARAVDLGRAGWAVVYNVNIRWR